MPSSRDKILQAIRDAKPPEGKLPKLDQAWTTYADGRQQFAETLAAVGGRAIFVPDLAALNAELAQLTEYNDARQVVSLVPGVGTATIDLESVASPHDLAAVDVAILPGQFAVAENAAIWISEHGVRFRVIYYLCQHLVLVLPASEMVDHMHAAYQRLATAGQGGRSTFADPAFGAFVSGPSKTADIEQALVIGAHGPKSLTVFLVG